MKKPWIYPGLYFVTSFEKNGAIFDPALIVPCMAAYAYFRFRPYKASPARPLLSNKIVDGSGTSSTGAPKILTPRFSSSDAKGDELMHRALTSQTEPLTFNAMYG